MNPEPFFYWINERQRIWWNKEVFNAPKPWTKDPILQQYRFCNVNREDDKVTIWVRENIRKQYRDHPALWHILLAARFINWPDTIAELIAADAWYPQGEFDAARMIKVMHARGQRGDHVWTNAYTVSTNGRKMAKPDYIVGVVLQEAWDQHAKIEQYARKSLQSFCGAAQMVDGIGGFMAYEVACDLRWCPGWLDHAPDIYTWANTGPGAKRGLNRLHGRPLEQSIREKQAVEEMQQLLELSMLYTDTCINWRMEMRDIEHSLCETDKYLRVKNGEGKPRSLYQGV